MVPFSLAAWAVPLGVAYRLRYDRRLPAALPSWRRGLQVGLLANYKSPFWRGYSACFGAGLLLIPLQLFGPSWVILGLQVCLLVLAGAYVAVRQWRRNCDPSQQVVIDQQRRTLQLPPLGQLSWSEVVGFDVEAEVVVTPRRDSTQYWVRLLGTGSIRRWKSFALPEHAHQVVGWLQSEMSQLPVN